MQIGPESPSSLGVSGDSQGWCEHFGVDYSLVRGRIKRGHDIYTALFHPKNITGKRLNNTIHDTHLTQK